MKQCVLCANEQPLDKFYKRKKACNDCLHEVKQVNSIEFVCCEYCGEIKLNHELSHTRELCVCKGCKRYQTLDRKQARHERTYKEYYEKNKETIIAKSKRWNKNNKHKVYLSKKASRQRHKNDLDFRIKENLGTRLRNLVRKDGQKFIDFLGCDLQYFRRWLSFNFKDDMTWDNYGAHWHIDHIIPCNHFKSATPEAVKKCWHWSNLVPLEANINASKADKIDEEYIAYYKNRKQVFLSQK